MDDLALHAAGDAPGGRGRRPARALALRRRRRARPRARPRLSRISHCGLRRAGSLRRGPARGADGRRGPGSRACLGRRCQLRRPPVARRRGHRRLRAIRASRSRSPAGGWRRPTPVISGRTSRGSSARSDHRSSSSRTSPIICASDFPRSPETWSAWATGLRQASSRRRKSARRIGASGSSSSPIVRATPTPTQLGFWPTPVAGDSKGTRNRTSGRTSAENHHDGMTLCDAISLWPTPQTDSFRSRGGDRRHEKGLDRMARDWPSSGSGDVDDADGAGPQGRRDEPREHAGERPAWPPGPHDTAGWRRYLEHAPELEPAVRRGADGLACRVDRLRVCGNGVVPLVAAHALRTLAAELLAGR